MTAVPKILIADDSPLVLRMIEKMLSGAGFAVATARDGIEAIERVFAEDVGLVILDVMMPRMNGYQACRILKTETSTRPIPVIILTSKDQPGDRFWGLETGANYYITKDADPHRILDLVKKIFASGEAVGRSRTGEGQKTSLDLLSRVNELLDRKLFEATILSEIGRVARSLVHFDETFGSVLSIISRVVDFTVGGMAFVEEEDLDVVLMLQRPAAPQVVEETKAKLLEAVARQRGGAPFAKVQARLLAPGSSEAAQAAPDTSLGGFAAFPIVTNARLSGMLALSGKLVARITPETDAFLHQVANQAQIVTENSRLFDRVKNLSIRDGLTDLFNHRHSIELLHAEYARVGRYAGGVALLMVDLDHFKKINDEHGHQAGDVVLREVARLLKDNLRAVDALGRYGGEEFMAILPHTASEEAMQTAERLRRAIEEHPFRYGDRELRATASVGVACFPSEKVDSPQALIRESDRALYRAKEAGRNCVSA